MHKDKPCQEARAGEVVFPNQVEMETLDVRVLQNEAGVQEQDTS